MSINSTQLNNNHSMPMLGLGTWQSKPNQVGQAVEKALSVGYRHIDCAAVYGNEPEIGKVFKQAFSSDSVKREDIFITSKLWNTKHHPDNVEAACRRTLKDLQLEYLDLYLMHWGLAFTPGKEPMPIGKDGVVLTEAVPIHQTWAAMESLVDKGLVKSIGVSNFTTPMILDLLTYANVKPVINQVELHPYHSQQELVKYCRKQDIVVTAYSPLGSAGDIQTKPISDKAIISIAKNHSKSPTQVILRWILQRGITVIPKSVTPSRIQEKFEVFDFELSDHEMDQINQLNKDHRFINPNNFWGIPYFN